MLDGFRIAQITDAHLRKIGVVEERIAREIENRNVTLVVLTGDIVDHFSRLNVLDEFCRNLQGTRRTVLATLGNWEHWAGVPIATLGNLYRSHGIRLLINESELIDSAISIAATDDAFAGHFSLKKTMLGYTAAAVSLFLTHSPAILDRLPPALGHFDLALAGHTHGGQGRIGPFAPMRPQGSGRFISGWYEVPVGNAYVSCGTGMSFIPARFSCRPELPIFSLRQG
jgi:predicted MPP superfamily phosphohydrolase